MLDHHNNYSAYSLDPEHGWVATHRLPLESAIRYSLDHKERYAGTIVAVVPDGMNPDPILDGITRAVAGMPQSSVGVIRHSQDPTPPRLMDVALSVRHSTRGYGKAR